MHRFKNRYNIDWVVTEHGEAASVDQNVVSSWFKNLSEVAYDDYDDKNIFNADETGLFCY